MNWNKLWTEQASNADKINKTWFAQSQKKEHLNLVSNKIRKAFCWNRAKHKKKMSNVNGIKAIKHILIYSRSDEGTPKSNMRSAIQESNRVLTESKPEVQKMLICSKSRESTAESKGATRFSNTSVDVQQIIVTNARNGKYCKQTCETKPGIKATLCGRRLKVFSKSTEHELRRIPVSNPKTLSR